MLKSNYISDYYNLSSPRSEWKYEWCPQFEEIDNDVDAGIEGWLRFLEEMTPDQPEDKLLDHFSHLISGCGKNIGVGSRVNLLGRCYDFTSEGKKLSVQYRQSDICEEKGTVKITSSMVFQITPSDWHFREAASNASSEFPAPYTVEEHTAEVKTQDEVDKAVLMWCLEL